MTVLDELRAQYAGTRVLVTGHTGFKGAWLVTWLLNLGARVSGYALEPPTDPSLFDQLGLSSEMTDQRGDIREFKTFNAFLEEANPEIVFHLAAQSLVRDSYERPLETVEANTLGTAHVLDAVRQLGRPTVVIVVTSDKCYANREWLYGYREDDPMGGYDVYSASKGAAELLVDSWRMSFFHPDRLSEHGVRLASVRAGNVIGGGDWAKDRIVPDCVRALAAGHSIPVRNPSAVRPWQHVLEPLYGYMKLGAILLDSARPLPERSKYCSPFNFGPLLASHQPVRSLVDRLIERWGAGSWEDLSDPSAVHEAQLLQLSIEKTFHMLDWHPCWDFSETVRQTADWYRAVTGEGASAMEVTMGQISAYEDGLSSRGH